MADWWRGRPRPRVSKLLSFRATGRSCFRDPFGSRGQESRDLAFRRFWWRVATGFWAPHHERSEDGWFVITSAARDLQLQAPAPASCTAPPVQPALLASASQKVPQYTPHAWERPRAISLVPLSVRLNFTKPPIFLASHALHQPAPLQVPHHHRQIAAGFQDLARDFRQHHRPQVIERFHHRELARRQLPTGQVASRKRMHGIAGTQQLHIGG